MESPVSIVYSPHYDIRLGGIEKLHPFDACKYSRAWESLHYAFGTRLEDALVEPDAPATDELLQLVHSEKYLSSLQKSSAIASALELPAMRLLPGFVLQKHVVGPMRYAVQGTLIAARKALQHGIAVNLSGGYHHASQQHGEGFCLFADVGVAVAALRDEGLLDSQDQVVIIDLDAHQGNGNEHVFRDDPRVLIMDMYNKDIYPQDPLARERIDLDVPVISGIGDEAYLATLKEVLPGFLRHIERPRLLFYNAGTDILARDPLGAMNVSARGVFARDVFVFNLLIELKIPFVLLPSGGYTRSSYKLLADSVHYLLRTVQAPLH